MITCTKKFESFPAAHRQYKHDGLCRVLHGHNFSFEIEFGCLERDENGFVIDFGKLDIIKNTLDDMFNHTFIVADSDPEAVLFESLQTKGLAKITWVPDVSCEGTAKYLVEIFNEDIDRITCGRVQVVRVRVYEEENDWADAYHSDIEEEDECHGCGCCQH